MSTFILNVDPVKVDRDYKMLEHSRTRLLSHNPMATKLEDLGFTEIEHHTAYPLFEVKDIHTMFFNHLKDYISQKSLPIKTDYCCMYCTEGFSTPPIGIPIKYIPSYYFSVFPQEKDERPILIKNDIHSKVEMERLIAKGLRVVKRDYFEVDGNFCSFPCMASYYKLYKDNMEYKESQGLMRRLHQKLYGKTLVWRSAPDIRLLKKFGGHMSIEEFRSTEASNYSPNMSLQRVTFSEEESVPLMVPVSKLFTYLKS